MTNSDTPEQFDVERIRAGLTAVGRITRLRSLPWFALLLQSGLDRWITRGPTWFDTIALPLVLGAIVMDERSRRRLDARRLAGPHDVLITHYRGVLNLGLAKVMPAFAVILTVLGGLMAVAGYFSDEPHRVVRTLPGVVLFLGALYPAIQWSRPLKFIRHELAALPPPAPPSQELTARARELVLSGKKIQAIKEWRETTGASLAEAKDAVERLDQDKSNS